MTNRTNYLSKPKLWMSLGRQTALLSFNRRKNRPTNHYLSIVRPELYSKQREQKKGRLLKNLTLMLKSSSGRSSHTGHITVRHRGGGHASRYRLIDFFRKIDDLPAVVLRIEKDPTRNSHIVLVCYANGTLSYLLQPAGLEKGTVLLSSQMWLPTYVGNAMPLRYIPIGTMVHNIQLIPHSVMKFVRAAGTNAQVLKKTSTHTLVRLPSTELRFFNSNCLATVGSVSNAQFKFTKLLKAGNSRWLGRRPTVRGVAMNPIDHPHGGGQGKTSGGRPSVTPWARLTKGYKTVRKGRSKLIFKTRI